MNEKESDTRDRAWRGRDICLGLRGFALFRSSTAFTERRFPRVPGVRFPETNSFAYAKDTSWHGEKLWIQRWGRRQEVIGHCFSVCHGVKSIWNRLYVLISRMPPRDLVNVCGMNK